VQARRVAYLRRPLGRAELEQKVALRHGAMDGQAVSVRGGGQGRKIHVRRDIGPGGQGGGVGVFLYGLYRIACGRPFIPIIYEQGRAAVACDML